MSRREAYIEIRRMLEDLMPNCSVPDCEFKAADDSGKCYCHARGFDPPFTYEEYLALGPEELALYRRRLEEIGRSRARDVKRF